MRRSMVLTGTVLALSLTLGLAACGGSSSSSLSKDEFLKRGNAICDTGNKTIDSAASSLLPSSGAQPDAATLKKFVDDVLVPNVKKQLDDIDALKPPKELQADVDKLLTDA